MAHGLQRTRQHHMVERSIVKPGQALFEVALDDIDAIRDRRQHAGILIFDAITMGTTLPNQAFEQCPIAATKIKHTLAGLHPAGDQVKISAFVHRCLPCWSQYYPSQVGGHHSVVLRIFHEEGIMAIRAVDFGICHSLPVMHQRMHQLARTL